MMTLCSRASFRCISSRNARTGGSADTAEAYIEISGRRMSPVTSSPFKYMRCNPSSPCFMPISSSGSIAVTAATSFGSTPLRNAARPMTR